MKRMTGGTIFRDPNYKFEKIEGKNILLIIDPQNDFSDVTKDKDGSEIKRSAEPIKRGTDYNDYDGNLKVVGASNDYRKIIEFIEKNNDSLDEIHVSLDTHTDRHIGHPGFWSRVDESGKPLTGADGNPLETDDTDGLRILETTDNEHVYKGTSQVMFFSNVFHGDEETRYYTPRKYEGVNYDALREYVKEYINFYYSENNKHGQVPWIWRTHCIEDSEGHKIAKELQDCLDKYPGKVKYHIKGQNNLAEMYSIFSAEMPVKKEIMDKLSKEKYTGNKSISDGDNFPFTGVESYEDTKKYVNLDTERNTKLMDHLLGFERNKFGKIEKDNMNRIFVCGEAKTHCVKSSLIDLMEYASNRTEINKINEINEIVKVKVNLNWKNFNGNPITVTGDRIVLLANMTSPIKGPDDDIVTIAGSVDGVFDFAVYDPDISDSIPIVTR